MAIGAYAYIPTLFILGRPLYKIMGWDTQKLALKNMKNIKHGTLPWLCPACQIELSIRSYQAELSNS